MDRLKPVLHFYGLMRASACRTGFSLSMRRGARLIYLHLVLTAG